MLLPVSTEPLHLRWPTQKHAQSKDQLRNTCCNETDRFVNSALKGEERTVRIIMECFIIRTFAMSTCR